MVCRGPKGDMVGVELIYAQHGNEPKAWERAISRLGTAIAIRLLYAIAALCFREQWLPSNNAGNPHHSDTPVGHSTLCTSFDNPYNFDHS